MKCFKDLRLLKITSEIILELFYLIMKALNPLEILIYPQGFETMKCFKNLRLVQIT